MLTSEFVDGVRDEVYKGWTKGAWRRESGDVCIVGAMDRVALRNLTEGGPKAHALAKKEICHTAAEMFPDIFKGSIPGINDYGSTTKDDVLALLDKTAMRLAEAGQ
jgi:hypothetical protein